MPRIATKPIDAPQAHDARRTFETALARIQQSDEPPSPSRTPIVVRRRPVQPEEQAAEKRALTEAARALALLWNISPTLIR
jgi:hypothetical protein